MGYSVHITGITNPTMMDGSGKRLTASEYLSYVARISNPENEKKFETAPKLIKYLMDNEHWSPFEMINIVMEIKTTRDIARQILRHRSFSFQEFSQRYADPTMLGMVQRETRLQDPKNRQSSIELNDPHFQNETARAWRMKQDQLIHETQLAYKWAIENGIAKEQARAVLPEGMQMSRMHMNGTLRSWMHYVKLRCGNGTQKEHQQVARECKKVLVANVPVIKEWLDEI